jgi:hypothetical protein
LRKESSVSMYHVVTVLASERNPILQSLIIHTHDIDGYKLAQPKVPRTGRSFLSSSLIPLPAIFRIHSNVLTLLL